MSENIRLRLWALAWDIEFKVMSVFREDEDISERGVMRKGFPRVGNKARGMGSI